MGKQNDTPMTQENTEKKMTKYDRKMQARKEAEIREKRQHRLTQITAAVIIALVVIIAVAVPIGKKISARMEYIRIGDHSINRIDYDFMYSYFSNYTLNMYTYFGLIDSTKSLADQKYDDNTTWKQYFDQTTVNSIRQCLILNDDAKDKGLTYDVSEQSKEFFTSCESDATSNSMTLSAYLKSAFGTYATKSSIKDVLTLVLTASAHNEYLLGQNKPEQEKIDSYYAENKNNYDTVTYNVYKLSADIAEGASDEEIAAAMASAKEKADQFMSRFIAGEPFSKLYTEYGGEAPSTDDSSEDDTTPADGSLKTDSTYSSADSLYSDWLFDEARAAADVTIITDESGHAYHIVAFQSRKRPDTANDSISDTLAAQAVSEYISTKIDAYTLTDKKNHLDLPTPTEAPSPTPTAAAE